MGHTILSRGSIGTTMYFLDCGYASAEIDGRVVNVFMSGDFFGEVSFIATVASILEGAASTGDAGMVRRTATGPCTCLVDSTLFRELFCVLKRVSVHAEVRCDCRFKRSAVTAALRALCFV